MMGCDKRVARPYHPGTLGVPFADVISALKCTKHSPLLLPQKNWESIVTTNNSEKAGLF